MPLFYHILSIPAKLLACLNAYPPQRIGHLGGLPWASVQHSKLHWNSSSAGLLGGMILAVYVQNLVVKRDDPIQFIRRRTLAVLRNRKRHAAY